ncbi:MAG: hypothetical protein KKF41_12270 [Actinobacteria bacterium]|nr:hypothetical protein [Actinomycetota bacterium]MBU1945081.1 hypothetical protein [Actinomycetota bacterium]MBU2688350.1 hypothetical protein [Actinomycetota bacterium]
MRVLPYDSFLIDGPWLVSIGWVLGKIVNKFAKDADENKKARLLLSVATIAIFYITSISLYFNLEWTRWIWEMCGAESGRDWMINSGVFNFDHENVSTKGHAIAALMFLTYPVWLHAGFKLADIGKD